MEALAADPKSTRGTLVFWIKKIFADVDAEVLQVEFMSFHSC